MTIQVKLTSTNIDNHLKEANELFGRLIKQLGFNNKKGSERYKFEVDFSHALNNVKNAAPHMQLAAYEQVAEVINELIALLKERQERQPQVTE